MLNQEVPALVLHEAVFESDLAAFNFCDDLLELRKCFLKTLRRRLILPGHSLHLNQPAPASRAWANPRTAPGTSAPTGCFPGCRILPALHAIFMNPSSMLSHAELFMPAGIGANIA